MGLYALYTLWGSALLLFGAGITLPMLTVEKWLWRDDPVSLLSGLGDLFVRGHWPLALGIAIVSVVLPLAKFALLWMALRGHTSRWLGWAHAAGRWAMLDVLVVAVLIVSVKIGAFATVTVNAGLYSFALSVVIVMVLTQVLHSSSRVPQHAKHFSS